jgi:hypothetical protein
LRVLRDIQDSIEHFLISALSLNRVEIFLQNDLFALTVLSVQIDVSEFGSLPEEVVHLSYYGGRLQVRCQKSGGEAEQKQHLYHLV